MGIIYLIFVNFGVFGLLGFAAGYNLVKAPDTSAKLTGGAIGAIVGAVIGAIILSLLGIY